jgi:acetylcholinesterase
MLPFLIHILSLYSLSNATPQVTVGSTVISGVTQLNQDFFGGIPYAQPPTGANRFMPPVLLSSLPAGNFDATQYGSACLQNPVNKYLNRPSY